MIEKPRLADAGAQEAAVIHLTMPRDQIQRLMGPAIQELKAAVSAQECEEIGPLFAHHLSQSAETFDFEVGLPVRGGVQAVGRVKPGALPAARVARTLYQGPYEGLFAAWDEFGKRLDSDLAEQMAKEGLRRGPTLWESYVVGPESEADPSAWRTELNVRLVRA